MESRWPGSTAATVQGEDAVIAMQSRAFPDNALMNFIFGSTRPGVAHLPAGPRPLVLSIHGGGFVFGSLRMSDWR